MKVCNELREIELGAILEKLRVIREFEWRAQEGGDIGCSEEAWEMIESCKDLFKCLLIINDDKRRELVSIEHGKHD